MNDAIERSRSSAIAAFRAGRKAGHLDALRIIVAMMDDIPELSTRKVLYAACEAIQRFGSQMADETLKVSKHED